MYANLKTIVKNYAGEEVARHPAWMVESGPDGITVHVDGNTDGMSSYYVEAGEQKYGPDHTVTVSADF